ncbi:MAG: nucleotidyltransferase family protein [Candidatus Melainabacteria bacterium]|nr:nucleotidyltransferase family protein [Candidatus Melainabacteria bacterium]
MSTTNKAWKLLIDLIFNNKNNIAIEDTKDFLTLVKKHSLENYTNFLRGIKLRETLLNNPWEWDFLKVLSNALQEDIQVLLLKGACSRLIGIYKYPALRESQDLDIFIYSPCKTFDFKQFLESLANQKIISLSNDWKAQLKRLGNVLALYNDHQIDIHFKLFSPLGTVSKTTKQNKKLEGEIIQRAKSHEKLSNIKIMSNEDFWLYNIFQFIKDFPFSKIQLILDSYLIIKGNKTSLKLLSEHAIKTKQSFLFKISLFFLYQCCNHSNSDNLKINPLEKYCFNIENIINASKFSVKSRLLDALSKGIFLANGNIFFSIFNSLHFFIVNNFLLSTIDENPFTINSFLNFFTKLFYVLSKTKNSIKSFKSFQENTEIKIYSEEKKLISVQLDNLKITFNVPGEFYDKLKYIWSGFISNDHLDKVINIEKVTNNSKPENTYEVAFNNNYFYMKLSDNVHGKTDLEGLGKLFANTFWDVRTFALCFFRALSFTKNNLLLVHSGAIRINNGTFLFPGGSSCGKTTFFNLLVKNGACGINDDTVLLKEENDTWYVYPTPFMSKNQEPVISNKSRLSGIIDLIKVAGGYEITSLDINYLLAILLNNSIADFTIDDGGIIRAKTTEKIINLSKQLTHLAQIKFSLEDDKRLISLIREWINNPNKNIKFGSSLLPLVQLRGDSMMPSFKNGDLLLVEEAYPNNIKINDMVCFTNEFNFPQVHRTKYLIRHKNNIVLITKGDNRIFYDNPISVKHDKKILKVISKL